MPGLSQYSPQRRPRPGEEGTLDPEMMDTRSPALANNRMSDQDNAGLDQMLRNIDSGASAPSTLDQARREVPSQGQASNPWLQWLMQYLQSKQAPQGQPR